jgi:hypothetical protein
MSVRIVGLSAAAVAVVVVAAVALSACGSAAPAASPPRSPASSPAPSPSASSSPASAAGHAPSPPLGAPIIIAVRLGTAFTPDTLSLAAGMKFEVIVSPTVAPSGLSFPAHCTPGAAYAVNDGMLSVTCQSGGGYLFTAERAGTTVVSATVRPHCSPGQMCPQWITDAALRLTIT